MSKTELFTISGKADGIRIESRALEEQVQQAVADGYRNITVEAIGQHGIGGRLWKTDGEAVKVRIEGAAGQRVGSFGYPNTTIEVMGPVSDDVGWLNAGAEVIVHGHATNGAANAMAQGKLYIGGNTGSRAMTMTKSNPRFSAPEMWVLGSVGDYFGEFMAGGTAIICGHNPQTADNILGYRPLVGMVGGDVYFRGPHKGYSQADAKQVVIDDADWEWLSSGIKTFLEKINKPELIETIARRDEWQKVSCRTPQEKVAKPKMSMAKFRSDVWDSELGRGGLIGDLTDMDLSPLPVITTGDMRRFVPVWENDKYLAPCQATCPTGIPVQERWRLVREGRMDEAVDMALAYTPFPATVCGYLCPNPCMNACTKQIMGMAPVDVTQLGKASIDAKDPSLPELSGKRIAVIGGGPGGMSVAWQLRQAGHEATIYDTAKELGGKISSVIPESRIPKEVLTKELQRVRDALPHVHLQQVLTKKEVEQLRADFDFIVVATGAQKPRTLPVPGNERLVTSLEFLLKSKADAIKPGKNVVIIGAGNVGCDVATEASRLGAETVTLIDVQEPAAFGKEKEEAEHVGAIFKWPCYTKEITDAGVVLTGGEIIPADTVVVAIGDAPDVDFLPDEVGIEKGFVTVNDSYQTTDSKIFAIGDIVKPGLITDAIGAGRVTALAIDEIIAGKRPEGDTRLMGMNDRDMIDTQRVSLEYYDPRISQFEDMDQCGSECASCGNCRDCGICVAACPQAAITRNALNATDFEYIVDPDKCIGCGFCAGACPCGIWDLVVNAPL